MSECSCSVCTAACSHKPGWFKPDQIAPLAQHLGLTEQELFDKHLLVDYVDMLEEDGRDNDGRVFVLSPAIKGHSPGTNFPSDPRGICHWFVDGKCNIHAFKPFECSDYIHDESEDASPHRHRHVVPKAWIDHQYYITQLLGKEPEADEDFQSPFGLLDSLFGSFGLGSLFSDTRISYEPEVTVIKDPPEDCRELDYETVLENATQECDGWCIVQNTESQLLSPFGDQNEDVS